MRDSLRSNISFGPQMAYFKKKKRRSGLLLIWVFQVNPSAST
jgi:hypothetical protein